MKLSRIAYPANLSPQPDGSLLVRFPDFPEALTDGDDRADALAEAADALSEAIAQGMIAGEDIPAPSAKRGRPLVAPDAIIAAKAALYNEQRAADLSGRALARRLGVGETEMRRILDPHHATKIDTIANALSSFGKRIEINILDVV
jgi:antitoxin HicB